MKAWELMEGKEYRTKHGNYRTNNGNFEYYDEECDTWNYTDTSYNIVSKLDFKEIKQPMTFMEAMDWMDKDRCARRCKLNGKSYMFDSVGDLHLIVSHSGYAPINMEMITGEWYKED